MMSLPRVQLAVRLLVIGAVVSLMVLCSGAAWAGYAPPPMRDAVTDTSGKLSDADDRALEEQITAYRSRTGNEIAVLVTGSLEGQTIEDVAYATFNRWGVGKKGLDNGVLLVIAPTERRTRIETGKGVGDRLTDIECASILRERVGPLLADERYREAVEAALEAIEAALDGKPSPAMPSSLIAMPLVRGAFIVDTANAIAPHELAAMETEAAQHGRYWADFVIVVVDGLDTKIPPQTFVDIAAKRKTMRSLYMVEPMMVVRVSASDRKVAVRGSVVWHDWDMPARLRRLSELARSASTLAEAVRAIAADQQAEGKRRQDGQREASRKAAQHQAEQQRADRWLFIVVGVGLFLAIGVPLFFAVRSARRGGGGSSSSGSSSSEASYGSSYDSSSSASASSSTSSSSSDTSYEGGGGTSGGGGASDSY